MATAVRGRGTGIGVGVLLGALVWLALAAHASAQAPTAALKFSTPAPEERVALVIGNSNYRYAPRLDNPPQDARAVAGALLQTGFELVGNGPQLDLDKAGVERVLHEFVNRLQRGTVGMFYYSGHGYELGGRNYLVPVDANPQRANDADFMLVDVELLLRQIRDADSKLNMIVLDACRVNPFGGRGMRGGNGLAEIKNRPAGTIISFATAPGEVARDGPRGQNSPYTAALVSAIQKPGVGVLDTFNDVSATVQRATNKEQQPWFQSSGIQGQFFFVPAGSKVTIETPPSPSPAVGAGADTPEMLLWSSVKDSRNPAILQTYLDRFPTGMFAATAKLMIEDLKKNQVAAAVPAKPDIAPADRGPAIDEVEGAYITVKRANIREKPLADGKLVKALDAGVAVTVTGKVKDTQWYRVATTDGKLRGFVFGDAIEDVKTAEEAAWQRDKNAKQSAVLAGFLRRFPDGVYAEQAKLLRDKLAKEEAVVTAAAVAPPPPRPVLAPTGSSEAREVRAKAEEARNRGLAAQQAAFRAQERARAASQRAIEAASRARSNGDGTYAGTVNGRPGDRYEGEIRKTGTTSTWYGYGVYVLANGERIEGEWRDGQPNGVDVRTWPNGDRYEGEEVGGKKQGSGVFIFTSGQHYEGEWDADKIGGYGVRSYSTGDVYAGSEHENKRSGYGILTMKAGWRYEGEWIEDKKQGRGVQIEASGSTQAGIFDSDAFSRPFATAGGN